LKKEFEEARRYKDAILFYQQSLGNNAAIFPGIAYSYNKSNINGNPFFHSFNWHTGDIHIYDRIYFEVEIKLDIYNDVLLLNHKNSENVKQAMVIRDNSLMGVFFLDRYFICVTTLSANKLHIMEGFYELVYHDKSTVLIKHRKSIERKLKYGTEPYEEFVMTADIYLIANDKASMINSKNALYKALYKHKKEIKRFIKDNRIKYSKQNLESITMIVRFYDSLD
jgi:hypothetical protein